MNIAELKTILSVLDIEASELQLEARLGADLEMDSQEIVELRAEIDRRFNIKVPAKTLTKASSVQQVLDAATNARCDEERRHRCESNLTIETSAEEAYAALHNLSQWTQHLPHVVAVEVLYDDGKFQEFNMDVASKTGLLCVRSVRRCVAATKEIEFFQPDPPNFLKQHSGGWRFLSLGADRCRVVTYHDWVVNRPAAAELYAGTEAEQDGAIHLQLLEHAKFALKCWKTVLEDNVKNRPAQAALYSSTNHREERPGCDVINA